MKGLETDHVISGPMRGLTKISLEGDNHTNTETYGHCDSMNDPAQRAESVKNMKRSKTLQWPIERSCGPTFCDLHTRLHLFQLIFHVIKPARCNFLLSYCVIYVYFELYLFLHKYVRLSPSEMHDFSLRDLQTFYLPPQVSIMLINS